MTCHRRSCIRTAAFGLTGLTALLVCALHLQADDVISRTFTVNAPPHRVVHTSVSSRAFTVGAAPHQVTHVQAVSRAFTVRFGANPCPGDLNCDGTTDVLDLTELILAWGHCIDCRADLNDDDDVGVPDLITLVTQWGPCP